MDCEKRISGFLYSMWSGELIVHEGYIEQRELKNKIAGFKTTTKEIQCCNKPNVVHNAIVWLTERDDELAKKIFIEYELEQISKLRSRIDKHLLKIKTIVES